MNKMYVFFTLLLFLLSNQSLKALPNPCIANPPSNLIFTEIGTTYFVLQWNPSAGAVSYEITVTDLSTGSIINIAQTSSTFFTQTGLTPDTPYMVSVSASKCLSGPYGNGIGDEITTGLVIVDVILQSPVINDCLSSTTGYGIAFDPSKPNTPNSYLSLQVSGEPTKCYQLEVNMINTGATVKLFLRADLRIAFNPILHPNISTNIGGPTINSYFDINFNPSPSTPAIDFMEVIIFRGYGGFGNPYNSFYEIWWNSDVYYQLDECHCGFEDGERSHLQTFPSLEFDIYPNPSTDLLNIAAPDEGQIEIIDLLGRSWYSTKTWEPKQLVSLSSWPAGTYIVQYTNEEGVSTRKRFIKQ